jgi:26S proteasome regulatory subunit N6
MEIEHEKNENELLIIIQDEDQKVSDREHSLMELTKKYTLERNTQKLEELLEIAKRMAPEDSKMYIAKLFKEILDKVEEFDDESKNLEGQMAKKILDWAVSEKKQFLINKLRLRYANILYAQSKFRESLEECDKVLENAKDIDDKRLLVEGHLLESKLIYEKKNLPKAKASLTTCRASANMLYIQPLLIAEIEFVAGIIHLAEKDYPIAYSYFFEAFEAFNQAKKLDRSAQVFVYLVLSKIMQNSIEDSENLINGRYGVIYTEYNSYTLLIKDILKAYKMKDLVELSNILKSQQTLIQKDRVLTSQIGYLYDQLLERNILKLIKPYSKVQVEFLSKKLGVDVGDVEKKICEMILDEKLNGSLDQENGILIIFEEVKLDPIYKDSLEIFENLDQAIDMLFERSKKIRGY